MLWIQSSTSLNKVPFQSHTIIRSIISTPFLKPLYDIFIGMKRNSAEFQRCSFWQMIGLNSDLKAITRQKKFLSDLGFDGVSIKVIDHRNQFLKSKYVQLFIGIAFMTRFVIIHIIAWAIIVIEIIIPAIIPSMIMMSAITAVWFTW